MKLISSADIDREITTDILKEAKGSSTKTPYNVNHLIKTICSLTFETYADCFFIKIFRLFYCKHVTAILLEYYVSMVY